jgi:small-conductance mechanosensitive channel
MWGNLFRTNSLEQCLHVVIVGIDKRIGLSVIGMNITSLHVGNTFLVVALSIGLFVFWLDSDK